MANPSDTSIWTWAPPAATPDAAPAAPAQAPYMQQVAAIWNDRSRSYQQKMAATAALGPAPAPTPPPPAAQLSPAQQLQDDYAHGHISFQQYHAAAANPGSYANPNAGKPPMVIGGSSAPAPTPAAAASQAQAAPSGPVQGVFAQPPAGAAQANPFQFAGGGAGGAGGVVPAHAVSTVSPETRALFGEADAAKMDAANQGEQAETSAAENEAASALGMRDALAGQQKAMEDAEAKRTKAYDDQWADYQKLRREAASGKIERPDIPMMGHIAMALGAWGAALGHTENFALQSINKRIDDNVADQRAALESKRESAKGALEGLGQMRARFGDDRIAEAAERARQLEQAKATGDVMVAQAKSPMLAAKWAGIRANIDAEQATQHAALEKWQPAQALAGGNKLQALAQKLYEKNYGHPGNTVEAAQQEAAKLLGMGQGGEAPVISGAPKGAGGAMSPRLARRMADLEDADKAAARLQAHLAKPGGSLSPAEREQAKADANVLRRAGYQNVPEDPLTVFSMSGARSSGVGEVRKSIATEKASLQRYGTGGGAEEPGENGDEYIRPAGQE
jgi:hypothetical protein